MGVYYNSSKIDSYPCPVKIVVSRRGLGKTFGKIKKYTERFLTKGHKFIYVVETGEMVKELAKDNGYKFWCALLDYYAEKNTSRKRYFYNKITSMETIEAEPGTEEYEKLFKAGKQRENAKLVGGTIKINDKTAGYILDINSYAEIKRNNFNGVKYIFIDEFISEKLDKTTLDYPRKISSILQSVARTRNIEVFMAGNTVRLDDPVLARMGFNIDKYGYYFKRDKYGLFAVLHFVDPSEYPEFAKLHDESVAGRFAAMLGETAEEENKFTTDLPEDRKLKVLRYKKGGMSLNLVKDDTIVTIKELDNGTYGVVPFCVTNRTQTLFCMTEKEQGFKLGYHIICNKTLKQTIMNMLKANILYYYSEIEYAKLKIIIKGD